MDIPSYILGRIKGSGGAGVSYVVVEELPTTGEEGTIYLVPKEDSQTDNVYNEYMYIEDEWELIGDTRADLSNYQTLLTSSNKLNADYIDDTNTTNKLTSATEKETWNGKQEALVSGTNIKTINGSSVLGSGDLSVEAPTTYLGKTDLYNTEVKALNLNDLKKGVYILKHSANNNKLWVKATYKLNSSAEPTTQTLEITLFDDVTAQGRPNAKVMLNEFLLYIDNPVTEDTIGTVSGITIGSLTITISDKNRNLANNFKTISLKTIGLTIGNNTFEDFNIIQTTTLPTASADNLGRIVQYIGSTNNNYTNGYFYKVVYSNNNYIWENIGVQSGGDSPLHIYKVNINPSNPTITNDEKAMFEEIIQLIQNGEKNIILYNTYSNNTTTLVGRNYERIYVYDTTEGSYYRFTCISVRTERQSYTEYSGYSTFSITYNYFNFTASSIQDNRVYYSNGGDIYYFIEANKNYSSAYNPVYSSSPATKQYVDTTHYTNITGYDATKTQVLKNINGSIQWVDE